MTGRKGFANWPTLIGWPRGEARLVGFAEPKEGDEGGGAEEAVDDLEQEGVKGFSRDGVDGGFDGKADPEESGAAVLGRSKQQHRRKEVDRYGDRSLPKERPRTGRVRKGFRYVLLQPLPDLVSELPSDDADAHETAEQSGFKAAEGQSEGNLRVPASKTRGGQFSDSEGQNTFGHAGEQTRDDHRKDERHLASSGGMPEAEDNKREDDFESDGDGPDSAADEVV